MRIPAYLFFNFDRNFDPISSPDSIIRPDLNNFLSMPGSQALGGVSAPYHSISNMHYWLLKLDLTQGKVLGLARCKEYDPTVRLTPWRGHDCFLTSWPGDESQFSLSPDERDYSLWKLHKATWSGDKKVLFVAHDAVETAELTPLAEEEVVKVSYAVEPGEYRVIQNRTAPDSDYYTDQFHMDTLVMDTPPASDILMASRTTVSDEGGSGSAATGGRTATPRTGDESPLGALGVGLAALGAATLAYERRRNRNAERHDAN